jgi:flavin-dependent dehydrogenase
MAKVHIVGAGPAGCVAALSAVRNGFDVVVSEEHPQAGFPENCSGLFSTAGLDSLKDFLDYRKHIINPIHGADIHFLDEKLSVGRDSVGFVCDRASMDRALSGRAEAEGAVMRYGERVKDSFHSDNIIGADGPISSVARRFGFPRIGRYASTLQAKLPYRCEDPHKVDVFLSNSRFPGFFGWIIPHDEHTAEFGAGSVFPNNAADAWRSLLKMKGIKDSQKPRGHIIPLSVRRSTSISRNGLNVSLVGDAAGQVKSTTGGGVVFGAQCAALAGRHADQPWRYEFEWRARHGFDLTAHRIVHSYLSSLSDSGIVQLGKRLNKLGCNVYLNTYGHMDRPIRMLRPAFVVHILRNIAGVA